MLQLFYIVWGVLCLYSFYFLFFRWWADLISEEDSGQQTLVDPRTSRQLKAPSPFSLPLFGTKLSTFDSPKEEKHWEITQLASLCASARLPKHNNLISPSGRKQQPPWCCRNDREMNCECLDANMWVCRVMRDANMSRHAETEEKQVFSFCPVKIVLLRFNAVVRNCPPQQQSVRWRYVPCASSRFTW